MTKGSGFAAGANVSIEHPQVPRIALSVDDAEAGETIVDAPYVAPKKLPRVLIVGPIEWRVTDLQFIQEYLSNRDINATTFRAEDLTLNDVVNAMTETCVCVVLVTGAHAHSWGNTNRRKIEAAAAERDISFRLLGDTNAITAADEASGYV